uniref:Uncharacterized protein n=1 Tax=Kalanchoe fedtschenkoi TaxID=63787 RepID=A0A7N0U299_KALFE
MNCVRVLRTKRCLIQLEKCTSMKQLKQSHAQVVTCGLKDSSFALSRLLAFCSDPATGSLDHGFKVFQTIEAPTSCIYNTMMKSFLVNGKFTETLELCAGMLRQGMCPDHYTLPYVLKACGEMRWAGVGEMIHGVCAKLGLLFDEFVGNSLIGMYCSVGAMEAAGKVFDEIPQPSEVSWTVMISGFTKQGDVHSARMFFDEAPGRVKDRALWGSMISGYVWNNCFKEGLYMLRLMQEDGIEPDESVLVSVLSACAHLGALDIGIWVHMYCERGGSPLTVRLGTSLIDVYAKCGRLDLAQRLFAAMRVRDTICWNVMIQGMAMHGEGKAALDLFLDMERAGARPDDITFIGLLSALSHSGMAYQGLKMLDIMRAKYEIKPKSEHYGCVVGLLSRVGLFKEAKKIIEGIPNVSHPSEEAAAWRAFLSACCSHGEIKLAEAAAEKLLSLEQRHSGVYVLLANLYAAEGKPDDAKRMRKLMRKRDVDKAPGCSSVEINGRVYEFIAGETTHSQMAEIVDLLQKMSGHVNLGT